MSAPTNKSKGVLRRGKAVDEVKEGDPSIDEPRWPSEGDDAAQEAESPGEASEDDDEEGDDDDIEGEYDVNEEERGDVFAREPEEISEEEEVEEEEEEEEVLYGKDYHTLFDSELYLRTLYPALDSEENEAGSYSRTVMDWLHERFSTGRYTGHCLLDVCSGPSIHAVISASRYFRYVYLTEYANGNRKYLSRWANHEDKAHDWSAYFAHVADLEGDTAAHIEDRVRRSIRDIVSCNLFKAQPFGFIEQLLPADCILTSLTLEAVASDKDKYRNLLSKFSASLCAGGGLFLIGALNQTTFRLGAQTFYSLEVDEDFVKEAVEAAGFKDIEMETHSWAKGGEPKAKVNLKEYFLLSAVKA